MQTYVHAFALIFFWTCGCAFERTLFAQDEYFSASEVVAEVRLIIRNLDVPASLLDALGDSQYSIREDATLRLSNMPIMPVGALREIQTKGSVEQIYRVHRILNHSQGYAADRFRRVIHFFSEHRTRGMAKEILKFIELGDSSIHSALQEALVITLDQDDYEILLPYTHSNQTYMRESIAIAMGHLKDERAIDQLRILAADANEGIQLAAARSLALHQNRDSVSFLIKLLASSNKKTRSSAALMLQNISGKNFGFFRCTDNATRESVAEKWEIWIAKQGDDLKLRQLSRMSTSANPFK